LLIGNRLLIVKGLSHSAMRTRHYAISTKHFCNFGFRISDLKKHRALFS